MATPYLAVKSTFPQTHTTLFTTDSLYRVLGFIEPALVWVNNNTGKMVKLITYPEYSGYTETKWLFYWVTDDGVDPVTIRVKANDPMPVHVEAVLPDGTVAKTYYCKPA